MEIAVLSDIHGNLLALENVLEDVQTKGCDMILFLGDYVLAGPEPIDTVNFCMSLSEKENIVMIQGNTDKMIACYSEEVYKNTAKSAPVMANALKDEVNLLGEKQKQFLRSLPATKSIEADGVRILMVHGSPRRNNEDIMPDTSPKKVEEMLSGVEEDLILCGHTHIPCGFQTTTRKTVVNAGSVGRPFTKNPESCYAVISTNGSGGFEIEHCFVKYDNVQAAKTLRERSFDGAGMLAQILINPEHRHI
ncbi:MAG: metallophosphatase family protein [Candidatus Gastranaerophilales bacterium]|nr:metallophosphatase family protein [Candidatus Gastranaerophilales bacterium]